MSSAHEQSNSDHTLDITSGESHPKKNMLADVSKDVELDTRIEMASWSFAQKDFKLATKYAEHVLEEVPGDPRALSLIAACQILLGNLDEGIVQLNHAINCTAIDGYEAAAEEAYEYLSFTDDDTVEIAWNGFNECIQFLSQPDFSSDEEVSAWKTALERARACVALERGDFDSAIHDLKEHLRQHPRDTEARFELARAYMNTDDDLIAAELLLQVLDEKPDHIFAASLLARVRSMDEDFTEAIHYSRRAFELNPQSCRCRLDLVEYLYDNHDYREALDVMADAPKCNCGWFRILHAKTRCYCQLERYESAMDCCQEMIDIEDHEVGAEIDLPLGRLVAMAHYIMLIAKVEGREQALIKLEQEAETLVEDKWLALETASLYREYQEFELAARLTECLHYENPDDPDVTLALAIAEADLGHFESEKALLKRLIVELPQDVFGYLRLATAFERDEDYKEALFWAFRGAEFCDSQGRFEYLVARIYCQLQAFDLSREHLQAAIAENSSFLGRAKADEVLTSIAVSL